MVLIFIILCQIELAISQYLNIDSVIDDLDLIIIWVLVKI